MDVTWIRDMIDVAMAKDAHENNTRPMPPPPPVNMKPPPGGVLRKNVLYDSRTGFGG
jgi:hypothetical protein